MNMLNLLVACVAGSLGGVCWLLSRRRKLNFIWWALRIAPLYFAIVSLIPSLNFWIVFWGGLVVVLVVAWLRGWRPRIVTSKALNVALSAILLPMAYTTVFIVLAGICAMAEVGFSVALPKVGIESRQWVAAGMTDQMPFAIEYKAAHPFLAEYNKRIAFKSGKRVSIEMDTGGAGRCAVYALGNGRYYLADGFESEQFKYDYIVDVQKETVRQGNAVDGLASSRRLIGIVAPNGDFERK